MGENGVFWPLHPKRKCLRKFVTSAAVLSDLDLRRGACVAHAHERCKVNDTRVK